MGNFTDFFPEVLPEVVGCATPLALNAIRNAVIEFCNRTLVWDYDIPAIDIVADTHTYTLTVPANTMISTLMDVRDNGSPVNSKSPDALKAAWPLIGARLSHGTVITPDDWQQYASETAEFYHQPARNSIRLIGIPTTAKTAGLVIKAALRPTRAAVTLDDRILDEYWEQIGFGAKGRLMAMPKQAWSDTDMAAYYLAKFEAAISEAEGRVLRGNARDNQAVIRTTAYY